MRYSETQQYSRIVLTRLLFLLVLAFSISACVSARISQFDSFAKAGIKFTDSIPRVLDEAFLAAVETDSLTLVDSRNILKSEDDRLYAIETSNENLKRRIALLSDLKYHASLLRSYFYALRALAQTEEASGISSAAEDLVESMGKIDKRITSETIGDLSIKDFVGEASSIVVATFQSAALNRELKERAQAIDRELEIQYAALTVLTEAMRSDLETKYTVLDRDEIILPYVKEKRLPKDWNARRLKAFKRQVELGSVDAAAKAARNLRLSYVALVENRLDSAGIALLLQDIDRILTLTESISNPNNP